MQNRLHHIAETYARVWQGTVPTLPRLEVIPWGVDTQLFAPKDKPAARRELDLPLHRDIVLCIGRVRIQDKMDWSPLLLAFEQASRALTRRPLLVLAGSADIRYAEYLVAQAAQLGLRDSVRVFFNCPAVCLGSLYAACDVFVSPVDSLSESFGLTIVEAMACGRPVIASDWNGYKELVIHGETGFKVRTDWADCLRGLDILAPSFHASGLQEHLHAGQSVCVDVQQMAGYMVELLKNSAFREKMGRQARARVMRSYDWPVVVTQWEALWRELGAIERTVQRQPEPHFEYLEPRPFQHFSHYATRMIDDSVLVRLTSRGRATQAGKGPLLLHPRAQGLLQPQEMRAILSAIRASAWVSPSITVGKLVESLAKGRGLRRERALMHIMWLAKYDLIVLESSRE